jgi:hypothetical protein
LRKERLAYARSIVGALIEEKTKQRPELIEICIKLPLPTFLFVNHKGSSAKRPKVRGHCVVGNVTAARNLSGPQAIG